MSARLVNKKNDKIIPMCDLKPGVLAEVVGGGSNNGLIVQKKDSPNDGFFVIGENTSCSAGCSIKVRILDDGELIEVNQ